MRAFVVTAALAVGLAACGDDAATTATTTTSAPSRVDALPTTDISEPGPGEAHVVLGTSLDITLVVETCTRDLGAQPDGQVPSEQVAIQASGARADGVPVLLDLKRFRSQGASPTITDTVTVLEGTEATPVRVLQAQRFEVDGQVTDPRDPEADDPLLRVTEQRIVARGLFAPPGSFAADGPLVEGSVSIACTG